MKIFTIDNIGGSTVEWVQIDNPDGSQTSMSKAEYDRRQAEQSTPNLAE